MYLHPLAHLIVPFLLMTTLRVLLHTTTTYAYDNYPIAKAANPMARGGPLMPYDDSLKGLPLPTFPIPPGRYPILQPPSRNMTQGSHTVPTGQQPDLSYCNLLLEAPVPSVFAHNVTGSQWSKGGQRRSGIARLLI